MVHSIDNYSDFIIYHRIQPADHLQLHYLSFPAIYMILSGNAHLFLEGENLSLNVPDLLVINSYEGFSFQFEDAVICQFILNIPLFEQRLGIPLGDTFLCSSRQGSDPQKLARLRTLLANYVLQLSSSQNIVGRQLLPFEILHFMYRHFASTDGGHQASNEHPRSMLIRQAMSYMQQHYREPLSLQDIADHCYVSVPYLSRLFKENFHHSIFNVLTQIRLANAWPDVVYGKDTLESIAGSHGFANARAFTKAFMEQYGDYPSQCRQKGQAADIISREVEPDTLRLLSEYAQEGGYAPQNVARSQGGGVLSAVGASLSANALRTASHAPAFRRLLIHAASAGKKLAPTLWNLLFIGDVRHISVQELKNLLPQLQQTFHYTYAYVSGLLSQLMLQAVETAGSGIPLLSFIHVDSILDLLKDAGLIPCIDLLCINHGLTDIPGHVRALLIHLRDKYGTQELQKWMFIPGSCPLNFYGPNSTMPSMDFPSYKAMVDAIRSIDAKIPIGSPIFEPGTHEQVWEWLRSFMDDCTREDILPDFYPLIHFPISGGKEENGSFIFCQNEAPGMMAGMLNRFNDLIASGQLPKKPVYIIEWNTSISNKDFTNDSLFKAAGLMKNLLECYDKAQGFGYSLPFDGMEMFPASNHPVHGGKGLVCSNGVRKPSFWALLWLRQMGDRLLARGDGYFITKKDSTLKLCLYNAIPMKLTMAAATDSNLHLVNMINASPIGEQGQPLSAAAIQERILGTAAADSARASKNTAAAPDITLNKAAAPAAVTFEISADGLAPGPYTITRLHLTQEQCQNFVLSYDGQCLCPSGSQSNYWNAMTTPNICCCPVELTADTLTADTLTADTLAADTWTASTRTSGTPAADTGTANILTCTLKPGEIAFIEIQPQ